MANIDSFDGIGQGPSSPDTGSAFAGGGDPLERAGFQGFGGGSFGSGGGGGSSSSFDSQAATLLRSTFGRTGGDYTVRSVRELGGGTYAITYSWDDGNNFKTDTSIALRTNDGFRWHSSTTAPPPIEQQSTRAELESARQYTRGLSAYLANPETSLTKQALESAIGETWNLMIEQGISADTRAKAIQNVLATWGDTISQQTDGRVQLGRIGYETIPGGARTLGGRYGGNRIEQPTDWYLTGYSLVGGDGGGGDYPTPSDFGGFGAGNEAKYNAPDRRTVEDWVRTQLKVKVGRVNEARVDMLTDTFMNDHRRNWDSQRAGNGEVDYQQSVIEKIRTYEDYKFLHRNRPSDMDEDQWVTAAISGQRQAGVSANQAVGRGLTLAAGGDISSDPSTFQAQRNADLGPIVQRAVGAASIIGRRAR